MARALRIGRKPNKPYIYNISTKKRFCQGKVAFFIIYAKI